MKTYFVDAFTRAPFKGNPAAVCMTEGPLEESTMQAIATEIGFSETAFVRWDSGNTYQIRFFTPKQEILLCGHATLASARILFDTTALDSIRFINRENIELQTRKAGENIVMEFPVYETEAMEVPASVLKALGIEKTAATRYNPEHQIILVEIDQADTLARLQPDYPALVKSYTGISGVLVTAPSNSPDFDFHYRYFWPWAGTEEDPVTGAIQTFLTKYWATKLGKNKLRAFQSSKRTGMMTTELVGDKVLIYGECVIVLEGALKFRMHET